MARQRTLLMAILLLCASLLGAQVTTNAHNIIVQVSTTQGWTDSGLDLQSGDMLEISAASSSDKPAVTGMPTCDPNGLAGAVAQTANLPLPTAPAGALIARLNSRGAVPLLVGSARERLRSGCM